MAQTTFTGTEQEFNLLIRREITRTRPSQIAAEVVSVPQTATPISMNKDQEAFEKLEKNISNLI